MTELHHKRKLRRKETAEDFTPTELVNEMLDKLPSEIFKDSTKTFLDPAAGNGNILVEVLNRKLSHNIDILTALKTIYGVELMSDNVDELKERLLQMVPNELKSKAKQIIDQNIICHDALTWDFENWKSKEIKSSTISLF